MDRSKKPGTQQSVADGAEAREAGVRSEVSPVGVAAPPSAARKVSVGMLLLGVALLWPLPLGGVLFLVAGGFGLAIASEAELTPAFIPGGGSTGHGATQLAQRRARCGRAIGAAAPARRVLPSPP